ncbi:hypothetical protein MCEREM21A_01166 [Sphingomonadaceae bacterium]|jgi:hypothetical protein
MPGIPSRKTSPPPHRWPLIRLAMHVRAGTLTAEENVRLADFLFKLAHSRSLNQAMKPIRGRPIEPERDEWVYEIAIAIRPREQGGQGLTVENAICEQAKKRNKAFDTIEKAWKSKRGRAIRSAVARNAPKGYEIGPI